MVESDTVTSEADVSGIGAAAARIAELRTAQATIVVLTLMT
jgi:hypothetical protein